MTTGVRHAWIVVSMLVSACAAPPISGDDDVVDVDAGADVFVLEVHTALSADGALILRTNLPSATAVCDARSGAPCGDVDADGLTDAWEDVVLDRLRPVVRFDEDESLLTDPGAIVADIGRVAPIAGGALVFVVIAYSKDYGRGGVSGHDGDPERVVLRVVPLDGGGPGDVIVADAYTAAHENTATDHGRRFTGADLAQLVHEPLAPGAEPRWIVYPSQDKHATYATVAICDDISPIPCLSESCAPDGVGDPSAYDLLPAVLNAGEDDARRVEDLAPLGFPGDDAWADQSFCGGQGEGSCSAKVRDKLLIDPFSI